MRVRFLSKTVASVAVVQCLLCAAAWPSLGANRGKSVIVTPTKSDTSVTNLQERLRPEEYLPSRFDSLRPQTTPDFGIQPPPRPAPPSRRQLEEMKRKTDWGLNSDAGEALGNKDSKKLLDTRKDDALTISGTTEGSIERFIRKANEAEDEQQAESLEEALRRLREEDNGELDLSLLNGETISSMTNSYRPMLGAQPSSLRPATVNNTSAYQVRPSTPSLFEGQALRSPQRESFSSRPQSFREFLDSSMASKPSALPTFQPSSSLQPDIPLNAASDFSIRPAFSGAGVSAVLNPIETPAARFNPISSPVGLNPGFQSSPGGFGLPAPTRLQPFAPLPQRNF